MIMLEYLHKRRIQVHANVDAGPASIESSGPALAVRMKRSRRRGRGQQQQRRRRFPFDSLKYCHLRVDDKSERDRQERY